MKLKLNLIGFPVIIFLIFITCQRKNQFSALKGNYFGQKPPGLTPEVFAPGIISTGMDELNSVFSLDGKEFLFSIKLPNRDQHIMLFTMQVNDVWTKPEVLPFSGKFNDADPAFSPDGNRLFFISTRPLHKNEISEKDWDIWYVDRTETSWSEPKNLDKPVNSDQMEVYPSITQDGTLYFSSNREGGKGKGDIYRSMLVNGQYGEPENIGEPINTENSEGDVFIAPDESYIIFGSSGRSDSHGSGDLYISFRKSDGSWTNSKNMGNQINSYAFEYCPTVSPDGKYFFFTSYKKSEQDRSQKPYSLDDIIKLYDSPQNGLGDVYWMDAKVIEEFRSIN